MRVFISPYRPIPDECKYFDVETLRSIPFVTAFYKSDEGPLGFDVSDTSKEILQNIVKSSIWYSEYSNDFFTLPADFKYFPLSGFNGIFMSATDFVTTEMNKEASLRSIKFKNKLLSTHNRPLQTESPTIFTDWYDAKTRKYAFDTIKELIYRDIDIAIGASDSLGSQLVMSEHSIFMKRMVEICEKLNVPVIRVEHDGLVPAW